MVAMWHEEEAQRHPPCGTYRWEWEEDPQAYVAEIEDCPACDEATSMQKRMTQEHPPEMIQGWYVVLVPGRFADGE